MFATCSPINTRDFLRQNPACHLIDVREFPEFAAGHVPGATLLPLGSLPAAAAPLDKSRPIVILCKAGKRAAKAAEILAQCGCTHLTVVDGGTDAWIAAGLPIEKTAGPKTPWALERQVRFAAGLLILAGLFIPPWPFLSLFVAAGLVFAALTNTCGLALLLAKLPWNRPRTPAPATGSPSCSTNN